MKIHEKEKLGRHGQNVKTGHVLRKHPVCKLNKNARDKFVALLWFTQIRQAAGMQVLLS